MPRDLLSRALFFLKHAGYATPPGRVACALSLARAEARAEAEGIHVQWEDDDFPWDADEPRPRYVLAAYVRDALTGRVIASLAGIGLNSLDDTYRRVVEAELASEALDYLDDERDARATLDAAFLASRYTFAAGGPS
jgi:hypothetical protein